MAFVTTNTYIQQLFIAVGFRPQIEERAHPKSRLKKNSATRRAVRIAESR